MSVTGNIPYVLLQEIIAIPHERALSLAIFRGQPPSAHFISMGICEYCSLSTFLSVLIYKISEFLSGYASVRSKQPPILGK